MSERAIIPCWEVPADFEPQGPFDLPTEEQGRKPPTLRQVGIDRVVGRTVLSACCHLGSYGMGGPGFLGLQLARAGEFPEEWLVLCLWAAADWVLYDGKPIDCHPDQTEWQPYGLDDFERDVAGRRVIGFACGDAYCGMQIGDRLLTFPEDPTARPPLPGAKANRTLSPGESLLDAWVVASTQYLAV